jgi:hypothetical protein
MRLKLTGKDFRTLCQHSALVLEQSGCRMDSFSTCIPFYLLGKQKHGTILYLLGRNQLLDSSMHVIPPLSFVTCVLDLLLGFMNKPEAYMNLRNTRGYVARMCCPQISTRSPWNYSSFMLFEGVRSTPRFTPRFRIAPAGSPSEKHKAVIQM